MSEHEQERAERERIEAERAQHERAGEEAARQNDVDEPVLQPQFGGDVAAPKRAKPGTGDGGYVSARPILAVGDAGPAVTELALLLASHGYPNPITDGERVAPHVLDDALMRQVQEFQAANGVDPAAAFGEDATNGPLVGRNHGGIVDAHTWEALLGRKPELFWDAAQGVVA